MLGRIGSGGRWRRPSTCSTRALSTKHHHIARRVNFGTRSLSTDTNADAGALTTERVDSFRALASTFAEIEARDRSPMRRKYILRHHSADYNTDAMVSMALEFMQSVKNSRDASVKLLAASYRRLLALPSPRTLASALSLTAAKVGDSFSVFPESFLLFCITH